jgi:hypothetical protein
MGEVYAVPGAPAPPRYGANPVWHEDVGTVPVARFDMKPHGKRALSRAAPAVKHRCRQEDGGSLSAFPISLEIGNEYGLLLGYGSIGRVVCGLSGAEFWLPIAATEPRRGGGNSAGFLEPRLSPRHDRVDQKLQIGRNV